MFVAVSGAMVRGMAAALMALVALHGVAGVDAGAESFDTALVSSAVGELFSFEEPILAMSDVMTVRRVADAGLCFVKVQGSDDVSDWVHNIQFLKRRVTGIADKDKKWGYGMKGFVLAFEGMRAEMWAQMQKKCDVGSDVFVFTGHSRGGAVAQVAATVVYLERLVPAARLRLVTFGSPRALRSALSDKVHNKFPQLRFVNRDDPVPSVPRAGSASRTSAVSCATTAATQVGTSQQLATSSNSATTFWANTWPGWPKRPAALRRAHNNAPEFFVSFSPLLFYYCPMSNDQGMQCGRALGAWGPSDSFVHARERLQLREPESAGNLGSRFPRRTGRVAALCH